MTIVLYRHRRDEIDDPKGAAEAEAFQAGQPVRTVRHHATPGIGADVIAELRADAAATGPWDGVVLTPTDPMPDLRASVALELATYVQMNYVLDDTSVALARLADQLRPLVEGGWPLHHVDRMLLMPYAARIADLLDAAETGTEATELDTVGRARELWFAGLLAADDGNPNREFGRTVLAAAAETGTGAAL